jgi:hypothetical protein
MCHALFPELDARIASRHRTKAHRFRRFNAEHFYSAMFEARALRLRIETKAVKKSE